MIKKVKDMSMVPADLQELLLPEKGEYIAIGASVYEIFTFPIREYLKLLEFLGEYFTAYNGIYDDNDSMSKTTFYSLFAERLINEGLLRKFSILFPDIADEISNDITKDQLIYLLGIIYKLNFQVKKNPIANLQTRTAQEQMLKMMGLQMLNSTS